MAKTRSSSNSSVGKNNGLSNGSHSNGNDHRATPTKPLKKKDEIGSSFSIILSAWYILSTFTLSVFMAFTIGWVARLVLLSHFGLYPYDVATNLGGGDDATAIAIPKSGGMSQKQIILNTNEILSGGKQQGGDTGPALQHHRYV